LEDALQLFEEGIKISRFCSTKLDEAERRVEILVRDEKGQLVERPFHPQKAGSASPQDKESSD
jgi:exodeoxyribonuclease VII small subunit